MEAANEVEPKYVTVEGLLVRAFFKGAWWICAWEYQAKDEAEAKKVKEKYVSKGFIPIAIRESAIRVF